MRLAHGINWTKKFKIRNRTAEFLIFQIEGKEDGVQVVHRDESIWCSQKAMAQLFDVGVPAISKHLKNIFETGELQPKATVSKMEIAELINYREILGS